MLAVARRVRCGSGASSVEDLEWISGGAVAVASALRLRLRLQFRLVWACINRNQRCWRVRGVCDAVAVALAVQFRLQWPQRCAVGLKI